MTSYLNPEDAQRLFRSHLTPIRRVERVSLGRAAGRVLAEDIRAPHDWPPFARAAMDGFAFHSRDCPGTLHVQGTVHAGETWSKPLAPGQAVRIMTGAPIPSGADTVLEQEAVLDGEDIFVSQPVKTGRNIMVSGHEYRAGDPVVRARTWLTPLSLGQLAALGIQDVPVVDALRVLILVTGDEIQSQPGPLAPGRVYDANGPLLSALLQTEGARVTLRYAPDQPKRILSILQQAARADRWDLVVATGGVSVGRKDYLPALLEEHFTRLFWRLNLHPGKAAAGALLAPQLPLLALSGNPGAALTAWYLIGRPLALWLAQKHDPPRRIRGRLQAAYPKPTREARYLKAKFLADGHEWVFSLIDNQSSDALRSFAEADGLVMIPAGSGPVEAGTVLDGLWLPHP